MSELFKAEATRLADYLSRVHGIKLKRASMLEAVAHLHGRPDWNTLLATGPVISPASAPQLPLAIGAGSGDRSLRPSTRHPLDLEDLGLGPRQLAAWRQALMSPGGLCLVVGSTGSGLTTTAEASSRLLAATTSVTVLDDTFAHGDIPHAAYEAYMRGDPGVLVCEIRDSASAKLAIRAAEAGGLVIATMHASSAKGAMTRLRGVFGVPDRDLAVVMRGILMQSILRSTCTACAGAGCAGCRQSGYGGRTIVSDVLFASPKQSMFDVLVPGADSSTALVDDAVSLVARKITDRAEAVRVFGDLAAGRLP